VKLLIVGLCLQGNKGGAALSLCLRDRILDHFPDAELTWALPSGADFADEARWARTYGMDCIPTTSWGRMITGRRGGHAWLRTLAHVDAVVDHCGVAWVGPPAGTREYALTRGRALHVYTAALMRTPLLPWTQSYGPFSTPAIRAAARADLARHEIVFCRGDQCVQTVRELLPDADARSFPDVAITLPWDRDAGRALRARFGVPDTDRVVTVSPSAVLYEKASGTGTGNAHVREVADLVAGIRREGRTPLLVPHTFRQRDRRPSWCDAAVSRLVRERLGDAPCAIADEDLSAIDLKSLIATADVHVGARYHSIVASLSAGVPTVAMSWHEKYRDIMTQYGQPDDVVAGGRGAGAELVARMASVASRRDAVAATLRAKGPALVDAVHENARLFADMLRRAVA